MTSGLKVLRIDSNMTGGSEHDGRIVRHAVGVNQNISVGELVLMVDFGDGPERPFATWGRVIRKRGQALDLMEAAEIGPVNGWIYAIPDGQE